MKCEALSHFSGRAGGSYSPCKFQARYKVMWGGKETVYLCGVHFKKIVVGPTDKVEEVEKC